jgi:predicted permease
MSLFSRIANAFRTNRLDRDLADELEFHIEARTEQLARRGMPREQAEREARRHFGNTLALRESSREAKLIPWLESLAQDVRFGARVLWKDRTTTVAAILSLSLAMGACAAAFALIDALLLRRLPVYQPERLVYFTIAPGGPREIEVFSYPLYVRFLAATGGQADLFTMGSQYERDIIYRNAPDRSEQARAEWVSGSTFPLLHLHPAIGRLLTPDDDRIPGAHPVAVISYRYWMHRFGGSPNALGKWFSLADKQYQIVGVMQKEFNGVEPGIATDLWVPNMMWPERSFTNPGWGWVRIFARLKPGVSAEQVRLAMQAVYSNARRERVGQALRADAPRDAVERYLRTPLKVYPAANGPSQMRADFTRPLLILAVIAGLVLLIACSNLTNLFTARALARHREMALRISIGAGRARLLQQVLIESGLLAGVSCAFGLAFARFAAPAMVGMLSRSDSPAFLDLHGDWRILAFAAGMVLITMLLFGLVPAMQASRVSPGEALKEGGQKHSGRAGLLRPMVAAQVAFSFAVLFVGGLLLTTFDKLSNVDLGFSKDGVALFQVDAHSIPAAEQRRVAMQWLDLVRAVPRVRGASISEWGLFSGSAWTDSARIPGRPPDLAESIHLPVSPGFLQTMGMRLLAGREFQARDVSPDSPAVMVNEAFAQHYFPGEDPIGKRYFRPDSEGRDVPQEIIGLLRNAHYDRVRDQAPSTVYLPLRGLNNGTLEVRTEGDPAMILGSLRRAIDSLHPGIQLGDESLQATLVANQLVRERMLAILSGFFAMVALVLAAVGLYGVLSYAVARRTREIGIRLALGAPQAAVVRLVLAEVLTLTVMGLAAGAAGGLKLAQYVEGLLFEVRASDLASLAIPLASLLLAIALAALTPAIRAVRVEPVTALRYE